MSWKFEHILERVFRSNAPLDPVPPRLEDEHELIQQLSAARTANMDSAVGLVQAAVKNIEDADLVKQTVRGVLARSERLSRNAGDA